MTLGVAEAAELADPATFRGHNRQPRTAQKTRLRQNEPATQTAARPTRRVGPESV